MSAQDPTPIYDPETDTVYSLEVIAELAGVTPRTVLHYHELGIISPVTADQQQFDTAGLRQLRRIEHLRQAHELTDSGVKFISGLLDEVEQLRQELRQARKKLF